MKMTNVGGFTLPGEAGCEDLTLQLARRWGADVIRDSDGTVLSPEITQAGYGIYSTICIIRGHNEWAKQHRDMLQQTFLSTPAAVARGEVLDIPLLESFFAEQFQINDSSDALPLWQVWDRTEERFVPPERWSFDAAAGTVRLTAAVPFHTYTVSFLAWRIWEEISMYNHVTNQWDADHLMPIDPVYPEVQRYLVDWLENWCCTHPATTVVRFTSLFYNFVWIWGSEEHCRHRFTDWASYDFTVSPHMLEGFQREYGYALNAEDFINGGRLQPTHCPPSPHKLDYMKYVQKFVADFGRQLVEIVHRHGKKAYLFYDDSWVGTEPYGPYFSQMGFDGIIKCAFSGFEARMCAGVDAAVHELRLHPYLFPVGLGGAPTFAPGGTPALDARRYWAAVRRALLRQPVDRIGLGGYLHLVEQFPDFCAAVDDILREFRTLRTLHEQGAPYTLPCRVAVLHTWGRLRSWTLSGHFHETDRFDLIHVIEALAGLPVDVQFLGFEDIKAGALENVDVLINAGAAGSAWSGGDAWKDHDIVVAVTRWVDQGGTLIGVDEPTAVAGACTRLRLAPVLGVEVDDGSRACHNGWSVPLTEVEGLVTPGTTLPPRDGVFLMDNAVRVLLEEDGKPVLTEHPFGNGRAFYMSHFRMGSASAQTLLHLILYAQGLPLQCPWTVSNPACECAIFPGKRLVVTNHSEREQKTLVYTEAATLSFSVPPFRAIFVDL